MSEYQCESCIELQAVIDSQRNQLNAQLKLIMALSADEDIVIVRQTGAPPPVHVPGIIAAPGKVDEPKADAPERLVRHWPSKYAKYEEAVTRMYHEGKTSLATADALELTESQVISIRHRLRRLGKIGGGFGPRKPRIVRLS